MALVVSISGVITSATFLPANAASLSVSVPCDGTFTNPGGTPSQTFPVAPGDSITFNSSAGTCDTLLNKALSFWNPDQPNLNLNTISGSLTLNVSISAAPGSYQVLVYQKQGGSTHPGVDWGQTIQFTIPSPTYPYSISGCSFNPVSNTINYGQMASSALTVNGTPDPATNELWFWHQRLVDGQELPITDPAVSQPDLLNALQSPYSFNYGSGNTNPGYYYPGHTLVENIYAIDSSRGAPVGSALCTLTTTFGSAPTISGIQQLTYPNMSCTNIKNNSSRQISNIDVKLMKKGNRLYISGIFPESVYYWAKINLNGATSTSLFTQNTTDGNLRLKPLDSKYVYDSSCNLIKNGPVISAASDGTSASFSGGVSGSTYYIAIKLALQKESNQQIPGSWPVTLTFNSGFGAQSISSTISVKKDN